MAKQMGCSDWLSLSHMLLVVVSPHLMPIKKLGVAGKGGGEVEAGMIGYTWGMLVGPEHE